MPLPQAPLRQFVLAARHPGALQQNLICQMVTPREPRLWTLPAVLPPVKTQAQHLHLTWQPLICKNKIRAGLKISGPV